MPDASSQDQSRAREANGVVVQLCKFRGISRTMSCCGAVSVANLRARECEQQIALPAIDSNNVGMERCQRHSVKADGFGKIVRTFGILCGTLTVSPGPGISTVGWRPMKE